MSTDHETIFPLDGQDLSASWKWLLSTPIPLKESISRRKPTSGASRRAPGRASESESESELACREESERFRVPRERVID
ncbi:hypothetical protein IHE45_U001600 [Dioscorea alata]|nr:hypothetical protein IHE45_U001600 [Dioscorea alata]